MPSPAVSEDMQLVTLDVRSLRCVQSQWHISTTPPSSVDLEWEHDGQLLFFTAIYLIYTFYFNFPFKIPFL